MPGSEGQDGYQGQTGAQQDPATDIQNCMLAPYDGPEWFFSLNNFLKDWLEELRIFGGTGNMF